MFGGPASYTEMQSLVHPHNDGSIAVSGSTGVAGGGSATSGRLFKGDKIRALDPTMMKYTPLAGSHQHESITDHATGLLDHVGDLMCNRWSVVTTIFEPSDAVVRQAQLENWCLCIVADKKGPTEYPISADHTSHNTNHTQNVVYLTVAMQEALGGHMPLISHLPWNHFGRKNVGYLYAILHGATEVWDFDDDNGLLINNGHMQIAGFDAHILEHNHDRSRERKQVRRLSEYVLTHAEHTTMHRTVLEQRRYLRESSSTHDNTADVDRLYVAERKRIAFEATKRQLTEWVMNKEVYPDTCKAQDIGVKGAKWDKTKDPAFNPYPIMGAPTFPSWPRGLPLAQIKHEGTEKLPLEAVEIPVREIGVIQSLANGDPDVDAIYRLTQPLPFSFPTQYEKGSKTITAVKDDPKTLGTEGSGEMIHPVRTPVGTYAPYNAQATLHMYPALWSLLLPVTVHGRVSDIWRGYFAQKLFEELGIHLLFAPPIVRQDRNDHSYIADLDSEAPLYSRAHVLIEHLRDYKFSASKGHFEGHLEEIWIWAYEHGYIELKDVECMQAWIESLALVGYNFPTLK
jgi:hypothetical protein